jgi:ankyrin repeat protein
MFLTLPRSADLEHLREAAKSLKKRTAAGDAEAIALVDFHRDASARGQSDRPIKLADVQFALARAYGFKSWPRLKAFVEAQAHTPLERGNRLLQEVFGDNWALLQELYERRDELPADDIFIAAGVGNVAAVESLIAADPTLAQRAGGPKQTQAITYAAHGRFYLLDKSYYARQQRIVKLLLAHGADPNSSAPRDEGDGRLSALYGCCRQTGNPVVAKLLLDAGANPDDGESLYHSSELQDTTCLELIFAAGVPDKDREWCIRRALDAENPDAVALYLKYGTNPNHLHWALFRERSLAVIQLLVAAGADVNEVCKPHWLLGRIEGLTPLQVAERIGATNIAEYLLAHGATDNRKPVDYLIGACWREDEKTVHANLHAQLLPRDHGNVATAARSGRLKVVQLMLDAGFNIESRSDDLDATPLNYAATTGDIAMVELLLARGAKQGVSNKHGGTPMSTAVYCAAHFNSGRNTYAKVVRALLAAGGEIPPHSLQLALEHHLDDIVEVLKEYGAAL